MAETRTARRAARGPKPQPKGQAKYRRDRPIVRGVFWREVALVLVCLEIAIFILEFDASILNVFDLTKASFTHALAWALLGTLELRVTHDGVV